MFDWLFVKEDPTETEIKRIKDDKAWYDPTSEEYKTLNERHRELLELKEMEHRPLIEVSGDTIVKCACMLVICGAIIFKEELIGPITSKALSLGVKLM